MWLREVFDLQINMTAMQLHPDTLTFLSELKEHNHKQWFDANRERYEEIRKQFLSVLEALIHRLSEHYPPINGITAKESVFRINRDIRFSKNKAPYKTQLAAFIAPGGRKSTLPGFYFHIEPNNESYIGGGIYKPQPSLLKAIRQEIDYNPETFLEIVQDKKFMKELDGLFDDRVNQIPRGYDKNNPVIEWLKYKSYFAGATLKDDVVSSSKLLAVCRRKYETVVPLMNLLNTCFS